jgi:hypothetical protein
LQAFDQWAMIGDGLSLTASKAVSLLAVSYLSSIWHLSSADGIVFLIHILDLVKHFDKLRR